MNILGVKTWSPASLAGKRAFSGMVVTGLLTIFGCYHTSMSLVVVWTFSLGWIMKATGLLRYNPAFMFTIVNLSVPCLYYENAYSCIGDGFLLT